MLEVIYFMFGIYFNIWRFMFVLAKNRRPINFAIRTRNKNRLGKNEFFALSLTQN